MPHFYISTSTTHSNANKALFSRRLLDTNSSLQIITNCKKNLIPLQHLSLPENTLEKLSLATSLKLSFTLVTLFSTELRTHEVPDLSPKLGPQTHRKEDKSPSQYETISTSLRMVHNYAVAGPIPPITAYQKTEFLNDILVHSCQVKPTSLRSAPNEHRQ